MQEGKAPDVSPNETVYKLDPISAAGYASRETLIDYTALGPNIRVARDSLLPFITWYAKNFTSYTKILTNNIKTIAKGFKYADGYELKDKSDNSRKASSPYALVCVVRSIHGG